MGNAQVQMWACYVEADSQLTVDKLRASLAAEEKIQLKSFATRLTDGVESVGTESANGHTVVYELTNGQQIHELTNEIVKAPAVCVFLSNGFSNSKYCCLELAGLLRRKAGGFPGIFLHCNGVDVCDERYRLNLSQAIARFVADEGDYLFETTQQLQTLPTSLAELNDWFEDALSSCTEGVIHSNSVVVADICADIINYRNNMVLPKLVRYNVVELYLDWINNPQRKKLRSFLNEDQIGKEQNHQLFAKDVFTPGALNNTTIGTMVRTLGDYIQQCTGRQQELARTEVRTIAGFLALTTLDTTWVASLAEIAGESVILNFPVKSEPNAIGATESLYSAIALSLVDGKVPRLTKHESGATGIKGLKARGAISYRAMPAVPASTDAEILDGKVTEVLRCIYREMYHLELEKVPNPLDDTDKMELQGKLTGYLEEGRSSCYVQFEQGSLTEYIDLNAVVKKAIEQLNNYGDKPVKIPFLVIKLRHEVNMVFSDDASRRLGPLRNLVDLSEDY